MGLFDILGRSPEEKEERRKNKFKKNALKTDALLSEFRPKITKNPQKVLYRNGISKNVELAKTKEEYDICANQFKKWFDIPIEFFWTQRGFKQLGWPNRNKMSQFEWNSITKTIYDGFRAIAVAEQYEDLLEYNNRYFKELYPLIGRITIVVPSKNPKQFAIKMSSRDLSMKINLLTGFSLYKLGMFEVAYKVFIGIPYYEILKFKNDEDDYEREVFKEYNNEIAPRDFIKRMEEEGNITANGKSDASPSSEELEKESFD